MTFLWRPKQIQRRNSISDAHLYPGVLKAGHFNFSPYKRRTVCLLRLVLVPLLPQSPSTPAAISNRTQLFLLLTDTFFSPFHPPLLVPFSPLLKPRSWCKTSPFHSCFFLFTWELCLECRTSTSTQHIKLNRAGSQVPGEGLHVTHRRSNLSVPCRHRELCTAPRFTKRCCSALTSSLAVRNGLAR